MEHLQKRIHTPQSKANLEKIAKSKLIGTINSQIKDIDKRIELATKHLAEQTTDEKLYKMCYAHLYTLIYEKRWLKSQLEDLENKYEDVVAIENKTYVWNGNTYDIIQN